MAARRERRGEQERASYKMSRADAAHFEPDARRSADKNTMNSDSTVDRQLDAAPESEILGVVGAGGIGRVGIGPPDNIQWTVFIPLCAWKLVGQELRKTEMTVRKFVSDEAAVLAFKAPNAYDVVRIKARWLENTVLDSPQALLTDLVGKDDSDSELNAYALELQEAVTFEDPMFGQFTLDRSLDWYEATTDWCGNAIRLTLPAGSPDDTTNGLGVARKLWAEEQMWRRKITDFAVHELLGLKNASWRVQNDSEVSVEEFARRLTLDSVWINANGSFEFWYDDGDLFCGHSIMVRGNLSHGPEKATIQG